MKIQRNIYQDLLEWKNDSKKSPLLILGQRQIGKTYIIKDFGKNEYEKIIEINFLTNKKARSYFEELNSDFKDLLNLWINDFNLDPNKMQNYLFFFDEIQECPSAISALKMINEAEQKINLICSGSYLTYKKASFNISFPVGQMKTIKMKQIMFDEFMDAVGRKQILNLAIEEIKTKKRVSPVIHNELLKWFDFYLRIGGFPKVVTTFIENQCTYKKAYEVLEGIYKDYKSDINKYSEIFSSKESLLMIYKNITKFIAKENKKFVFQELGKENGKSKKYRDLEKYLIWLNQSNLVVKIENLKSIKYPLIDKTIDNYFKIYYNDHGFLGLNYGLNNNSTSGNFNEIKGGLFENFVVSQFLYQFKIYYYSWIEQGARYKIDFVVANNQNESCLIEIKSGQTHRLTSLNKIKNYPYKFVLSTNNYEEFETHTNIPIYFAFMLKEIISETE